MQRIHTLLLAIVLTSFALSIPLIADPFDSVQKEKIKDRVSINDCGYTTKPTAIDSKLWFEFKYKEVNETESYFTFPYEDLEIEAYITSLRGMKGKVKDIFFNPDPFKIGDSFPTKEDGVVFSRLLEIARHETTARIWIFVPIESLEYFKFLHSLSSQPDGYILTGFDFINGAKNNSTIQKCFVAKWVRRLHRFNKNAPVLVIVNENLKKADKDWLKLQGCSGYFNRK